MDGLDALWFFLALGLAVTTVALGVLLAILIYQLIEVIWRNRG